MKWTEHYNKRNVSSISITDLQEEKRVRYCEKETLFGYVLSKAGYYNKWGDLMTDEMFSENYILKDGVVFKKAQVEVKLVKSNDPRPYEKYDTFEQALERYNALMELLGKDVMINIDTVLEPKDDV